MTKTPKAHPLAIQFLETTYDAAMQQRNQERSVDSITDSLRVEGYDVKREEVVRRVQRLSRTKDEAAKMTQERHGELLRRISNA